MVNDNVFKLLNNIAELQATIQNLKTKIDTVSLWLHSKFDILPEDIKDVLSYDEFCTDEIVNNKTSETSPGPICQENWIAVTSRSELNEKTDISNNLDNEAEDAPNIKEEDVEIKEENISEDNCDNDPRGELSPSYSVPENDANNYSESKLRSENSTGSGKYQLTKTLVVQLHDVYKTKSPNHKTHVQDSTARKEHQSLLQKPTQDKIIVFLEKSDDFSYQEFVHRSEVQCTNELFMCDFCREEFQTELGLKNHKRKSHDQSKSFHCHYNDCKRTFTLKNNFVTHLRNCHPDYDFAPKNSKKTKAPIYKCPFKDCNKLYSNEISFSKHLKRENHFAEQSGDQCEDSSRRCQKCLHCFATEEEFSVHTSQCEFSCELCNKVYNSKPALSRHLETHGNTFKCSFNNCGKILSSTKALVQHKKLHLIEIQPESTKSKNTRKNIEPQPDENIQSSTESEEHQNDTSDCPNAIVCRKCGKDCKTREALNEHILSNCYKCKICKKTFVFKSEQNEHLTQCMTRKKKTERNSCRVNIKCLPGHIVLDKPFCKICRLNFTVQSDFEDHMAEHRIKLFTCPHAGCKRKFPTEEQMGEHKIKLHCRSCPISFPHLAHFKLHNEKTHGGHAVYSIFEEMSKDTTEANSKIRNFVMGFQCGKCRRVFETLQTMINHVELGCIGCKTCGQVFLSKFALEMHIKIVHKREKSFLCNSCGKSLSTKFALLTHMESQHSSHKKQFKCMSCDKIFMSQPGYLRHVKLHEGEGRQRKQCDICGFDFANANSLKKHIEGVHEKQRRFPCRLCEKRFKTKTHRKIHLKTHENPNGRKRGLNKDADDLIAAAKRRKLK